MGDKDRHFLDLGGHARLLVEVQVDLFPPFLALTTDTGGKRMGAAEREALRDRGFREVAEDVFVAKAGVSNEAALTLLYPQHRVVPYASNDHFVTELPLSARHDADLEALSTAVAVWMNADEAVAAAQRIRDAAIKALDQGEVAEFAERVDADTQTLACLAHPMAEAVTSIMSVGRRHGVR